MAVEDDVIALQNAVQGLQAAVQAISEKLEDHLRYHSMQVATPTDSERTLSAKIDLMQMQLNRITNNA